MPSSPLTEYNIWVSWLICLVFFVNYVPSQPIGGINQQPVTESVNAVQQITTAVVRGKVGTGDAVAADGSGGDTARDPSSSGVQYSSDGSAQSPSSTPAAAAYPNTTYGLCSDVQGSHYHGGSCYKVFEDLATWEEAEAACGNDIEGGRLAEPPDTASLKFVYNLMVSSNIDNENSDKHGAWIGARRKEIGGDYIWASNDLPMWDVPREMIESQAAQGLQCVVISRKGKVNGKDCGINKRRVCQYVVDPICPGEYRYYDGYCYIYIESEMNYQEAKSRCASTFLSRLVEIHTYDSPWFLQELIFERAWITINTEDVGKDIYLKEHSIQKTPGQPFCFAVKGVSDAFLTLTSAIRDTTDVCFTSVTVYISREDGLIVGDVSVCEDCTGTPNGLDCRHKTLSPTAPAGYSWSYYCITQYVKSETLTVSYVEGDSTEIVELIWDPLGYEVTDVFLAGGLMQYQFKFPKKNDVSVYLGAIEEDDKWESGASIVYDVMDVEDPASLWKSPQSRLIFNSMPADLKSVNPGYRTSIGVCQYQWGGYTYSGFVPTQLRTTSYLYITYSSQAVALLNFDPNRIENTLIKTRILTIDPRSHTTVEMSDTYDADQTNLWFVVRSDKSITVELFSRSDRLYTFSALTLPWVSTSKAYVLTGPQAVITQVTVFNQMESNEITIQIPQFRMVYVIDGDITHRVYQTKLTDMTPFELRSVQFKGDIRGSTISGIKNFSAFIASSKSAKFLQKSNSIQEDIYFSQLLPASYMGYEYPQLYMENTDWMKGTEYQALAMMDGSNIEISKNHQETLDFWGDAWTKSAMTTPSMAKSLRPFVFSITISYLKMSCAVTLLPPRYWRTNYVIAVTSYHHSPTLFLMVQSLSTSIMPQFYINDDLFPISCIQITASNYYGCHVSLAIGIQIIKSSVSDQRFGAYILGTDSLTACYFRIAGIRHTDTANFNYQLPTFEEPERCPDPEVTTIGPTTESDHITTVTAEPPPPAVTCPPANPDPSTELLPSANGSTASIVNLPPTTTSQPQMLYPYQNSSLTVEEIEEEIREEVRKELAVDSRQVSSFVRKKISAKDGRTSSTTMGYVGIVIISMTMGLLIVPDVMSAFVWMAKWLSGHKVDS